MLLGATLVTQPLQQKQQSKHRPQQHTTTAISEPKREVKMSNGENNGNIQHLCHIDNDSNDVVHRSHINSDNNDNIDDILSNDDSNDNNHCYHTNNDSVHRYHSSKSSNNDDNNPDTGKSQTVEHVIDLPGVAARPLGKPTVTFKLVGITMGVVLGFSLLIQVPYRRSNTKT